MGIAIVVPSYDRRRAKYNAQAAELRKEYEAKKAALDAKSSNKKQKVGKDAAVEGDEGDDDDDDDDDEEEEEEVVVLDENAPPSPRAKTATALESFRYRGCGRVAP